MGRGHECDKKETGVTEQPPKVTTAIEKKNHPKEDRQKDNTEHLIQRASERWKLLNPEIKKAFFAVKIEDFRQYWSTNPTSSTIMEIIFPPSNAEDAFLRCSICFKCRQIFHGECQFRLHLDNHLASYFMAGYLQVYPASPQSTESIDTESWIPIDLDLIFAHKEAGTFTRGKIPVSTDPERKELLKEIGKKMISLHQSNRLTEGVDKFIRRVARKQYKGMPSAPSPEIGDLRTVISILKPPSLREILELLDVLFSDSATDHFHEFFGLTDKPSLTDDDPNISSSSDKNSFVLDTEQFRGNEYCENEVATDSVDSTKLVSWILSQCSLEERLDIWSKHMDQVEASVLNFFKNVDEQSEILRECWQRKHQLSAYATAYRSLQTLLKDESVRDLKLSFFNILNKRKKEHNESKWNLDSLRVKYESSAIACIVTEAMSMNFNGKPENVKATSAPSSRQVSNKSVQMAIRKLKKQTVFEIMKTEAQINAALYKLCFLAILIKLYSSCELRYITVPLIQSFLRARLADLVDVDAPLDDSEEAIAEKR